MANFLYNGVELPDINTVWTHELKEQYSCACLADWSYSYGGGIMLILSERPPYWDSSMRVRLNGWFRFYDLTDGVYVFNRESSTNDYAIGKDTDPVFWTSADIINTTDNTIYLAASTPIRVDSKLKISIGGGANGDGFALYNGVKLPNIDSVWDKATYSCATIFFEPVTLSDVGLSGDEVVYYKATLWVTSSPFQVKGLSFQFGVFGYAEAWGFRTNFGITALGYQLASQYGVALPDTTSWSKDTNGITVNEGTYGSFGEKDYLVWTSENIYDHVNSTTILAASDPIPLDGMNVIEWDGDTTGLEVVEGLFYRVSDYVDTSNGVAVYTHNAENLVCSLFQKPSPFGMSWGVVYDSESIPVAFGDDGGAFNSGLYFLKDDAGYTTLFAYKAESGGGSVTATTADVTFTCTNLENTEPVDSIHVWVYKKSDGLNTTISPTWTSELFKAPSYSTTHTFTGLTPSTEYEVYGCIFVNGEATDHNAIAAFTTLEGEGEEEPVITVTSGDGFALYNGVKLPNVDSVWTDKETYPYAVISMVDMGSIVEGSYQYGLALLKSISYFEEPQIYTDDVYLAYLLTNSPELQTILAAYGANAGLLSDGWISGNQGEINSGALGVTANSWANHDILNPDGSTYLAASDPIPLNGMTVIEWNGGTAGLTNSGTGLYKITDDVFASNQVIGGVFVQNVSSKLTAIPITTAKVSAHENGISIDGKIYTSPANTLMPEAGTYFVKLVSDYVSLFAYPNAADLKPVYKRVSGVWVKKTAYEWQNGEWVLISTAT